MYDVSCTLIIYLDRTRPWIVRVVGMYPYLDQEQHAVGAAIGRIAHGGRSAEAAASVAAAAAGEETQRREAAAKNHQSFVLLKEIFEMRLKFLHESA